MKKILAAAILAALTATFSAGAAMPFGGHDRGPGPDRRPPVTARHDRDDKQLPPGIQKKIEKKDGKKDLPPGIEKKIEKDRRDDDRRPGPDRKAPPPPRRDDRRDNDRWDNDRRDHDRHDNDRRDNDRRDRDDDRGGILGNILEKLKD